MDKIVNNVLKNCLKKNKLKNFRGKNYEVSYGDRMDLSDSGTHAVQHHTLYPTCTKCGSGSVSWSKSRRGFVCRDCGNKF
jgi:DNA-directed RNA polymerase subunit RPC12/RpoP